MIKPGRAWVFGDNINTDLLAPGLYMKGPPDELAKHCLEAVDPDFAKAVQPGDIVVAGCNFGLGSSREQAAQVLTQLGVVAVLAHSFAGIFYRNAFNLGLLAVVCPDCGRIRPGELISVDPEAGKALNHSTGETYSCDPVPSFLIAIVQAGGLVPHLESKLAEGEIPATREKR